MIDTVLGLRDEASLVCETVPFDGPAYFAFERRYRVPGEDVVIARYHDIKWEKKNDFEASPLMVETSRGALPLEVLEKSTGVFDGPSEFNCWVEYRPVGEDEIVHRSAHTKLKMSPPPVNTFAGNL